MHKAQEIYDFYNKDHYIETCKRLKNIYTFEGDISITWGDDLLCTSKNGSLISQSALKKLLKDALDYRNMFGFCPIKIVKDKNNPGKKIASIPEFGSGGFILVYNTETMDSKVDFLPYDMKHYTGFTGSILTNEVFDNSIQVYTWPSYTPSITSRNYKSRILPLFEEYYIVTELQNNAVYADWKGSHPNIFTQSRPEKINQSEVTEDEVLGDADLEAGARETTIYKRDTHRSIRMETTAKSMNDATKNGCDENAAVSKRLDDHTGRTIEVVRTRNDNMVPLPTGEEMAKSITYTTRNDFLQWKEEYHDKVCSAMGIPRNFIDKQSKFKTEVGKEEAMLKKLIKSEREDATEFYQFVYEVMYRERDDQEILNAFIDLDNRKKNIADDNKEEDRDTIKNFKKKMKKISCLENRISLSFAKDPFPDTVNIQTAVIAAEREVLSPEEEINLIRLLLELKKIEPNDELVKNKEEERKLKRQNLKTQNEQMKLSTKGVPASVEVQQMKEKGVDKGKRNKSDNDREERLKKKKTN